MDVTQELATTVVKTRFEDLPAKAVDMIRDGILDMTGIAFLGYYKEGQPFIEYAKDVGMGTAESTIVGDGSKVSCMVAAGVNAAMGHGTDFMDGGPGYPALCSLVPSGIAVAERVGASGKDLITAVALGHDIGARLHRAAFPLELIHGKLPPRDASFPGTDRQRAAVIAITASKLLGLNELQTNNAICIAWHFTPLPSGRPGVPSARAMGPSASNLGSCQWGIQAALLAQKGFQGPADVLGRETHYDQDRITSSPSPFYYSATELHLKNFIASRGVHPGISAAVDIVQEQGIKPEEIQEIKFRAKRLYMQYPFNTPEPKDYYEAVNSVPWAFAMALLGYEAGPEWLTEERLNDPVAIALAKKVNMADLPRGTEIWESGVKNPNEASNEVEVVAKGNTFEKTRTYGEAVGSSLNPMSKEQLEGKFKAQATPVIGKKQSEELVALFHGLQDQKDVRNITRLFGQS